MKNQDQDTISICIVLFFIVLCIILLCVFSSFGNKVSAYSSSCGYCSCGAGYDKITVSKNGIMCRYEICPECGGYIKQQENKQVIGVYIKMLKIENVDTYGWEAAIRGLRNPMNSWAKSDSYECGGDCDYCPDQDDCHKHRGDPHQDAMRECGFYIGDADLALMKRMNKGGPEESKYRRMITATLDVTAPLYWWKEYDTYKVGTVANSCSTMHKIAAKEFTPADFSLEHIGDMSIPTIMKIIEDLNLWRKAYNEYENMDQVIKSKYTKKQCWYNMIQLLPSSYNQCRTLQLNYEVLANIYRQRRHHKLDEWHTFCNWIEKLPYAELIVGEKSEAHNEEN